MKRIIAMLTLSIIVMVGISKTTKKEISTEPYQKVLEVEPFDEWEIFVQALIWVESKGNIKAIGKTNDLGILQITPIYVREVNRIIKDDRYSHSDALDSLKSIEMFNIVQSHHNKNKCIRRAISKHNPNAGDWYAQRIYDRMNEIINK